ncbi:MAG: TetR/AcrR family transcriptional regulator [Sinobacteraceae bacterium]|nr:TetR/AcrR family transcriptional regulator [Nevskia sp.]MDI3260857.1 TetR/AcrR family transcriptional regulator [Nevskiaceae bacterium]
MKKTGKRAAARRPAKRGRLRREQRWQQLLDVALRLFIRRGYQGTSIGDLARAAGVTRPIIYHHFGSKDGIYLACLRQARQDLERRMMVAGSRGQGLAERLRNGIEAYFAFVEDEGDAWGMLFGGGVAVAGPAAEEARQLRFATVGRIVDLLRQVLPHVDAQTLEACAHAVSGSGEQLAKWWRQNPHIPRERVVDYHWRISLHGLAPLEQTGRWPD